MQDRNRLKKSADFQRVYAARRRRDGSLVAIHSRPNQLAHPRVGLSVSSKVGGAVARNTLKRRLRVICRRWVEAAGSNAVDVVVVARPAAATASFSALQEELGGLLRGVQP
jgi:ribonuclease P protein component